MGTVYWKADASIVAFIDNVMEKYHQDLHINKVKIGTIMAMSSSEETTALKLHGYPVAAMVKIVPLKDRITKEYDVEMLVDATLWKESSIKRKTALIDHELSHLAVKRKKPEKPKKGEPVKESGNLGEVVYDDIGRPVVKTVKADYNVGDGFLHVIQRHQEESFETININNAMNIIEQALETETVEIEKPNVDANI
jgi:hypothetical protein